MMSLRFKVEQGGWRAIVCLAIALSSVACSNLDTSRTQLQAPSDVPKYQIDVEASELRVIGVTNAEDLRKIGADALGEMVLERSGRAVPARFDATLRAEEETNVGGAICFYALAPLFPFSGYFVMNACRRKSLVAHVDLRFETADGTLYVGEGRSSHGTSECK